MTADLPFVHPAQDPPVEATERAWRHVDRTVRRRRQRRRTVGSVALVAVAAAGVVGATGLLTGDGGDDVVAGDEQGDRPDVEADTEWSDPILSADGRTLTILVGHSLPGDGPCDQNFTHEVVETDESVTVAFDEQPGPPLGEDEGCEDMLQPQRFAIELAAPLGDRAVYDGIRSHPQVVYRLADLVEVTAVPDGWVAEDPMMTGGGGEAFWQQMFFRDGADWYFSVSQQPADATDSNTPEGTPTPVTVHGIEGVRYTGQMTVTMESIRWTEAGLTITVWGEMQGPPTFTHGDELLQIAEGVRPPTAAEAAEG